jgi:hypothetical protein
MRAIPPRGKSSTVAGPLLLVVLAIVGVLPWRVTAQEPGGLVDTFLRQPGAERGATAEARLLVLEPDAIASDDMDTDVRMPTFKALVSSQLVLKEAMKRIPEEHRVNLNDLPEGKQIGVLRGNLTVRAIPDTNMLELQYRAEDSAAAAAVLQAVIDAYVDFFDRAFQGLDAEVERLLRDERANLVARIRSKEEELRELLSRANRNPPQSRPETQHAGAATVLENELLEKQDEIAKLRERYGDAHAKVRAVQNRIETLKTALALQAGEQAEAAAATRRGASVQIELLKTEIARLHAVDETILERIAQIDLRGEASRVRVRVLAPPGTLTAPGAHDEIRPSAKKPESEVIQAGDVLSMAFTTKHSAAGLHVSVQVADDGTVDIPLIGEIHLAGMSPGKATTAVRKACADRGVLPDAKVEIDLKRASG